MLIRQRDYSTGSIQAGHNRRPLRNLQFYCISVFARCISLLKTEMGNNKLILISDFKITQKNRKAILDVFHIFNLVELARCVCHVYITDIAHRSDFFFSVFQKSGDVTSLIYASWINFLVSVYIIYLCLSIASSAFFFVCLFLGRRRCV